jgi:PAS domain S-box-containing protein
MESRSRRVELTAVLDATTAAIMVIDSEGLITYANHMTAALAGLAQDELIGTYFDNSEWRARDRTGRLLERDEYPVGRALAGESVVGAELLVDNPDRGTVVMMASAVPLLDADGRVAHVVATVEDVTEATGWEAQVEASAARFAAVFDHAAEAMLLFDDGGAYLEVNPAAARLLRREADDLVGRHYREVMADPADSESRWSHLMRTGMNEDIVELVRGDGTAVTVAAQSVVGVEPGVNLTVWRDVTEQLRTTAALEHAVEREREAGREQAHVATMKDVFLSAVSHELRTPLTAIAGVNDTLLTHAHRLDGDLARELLVRQQHQISRLQDMLADLLDLDRLRRGLMLAAPTSAVLSEVVAAAAVEVGDGLTDLTVDVEGADVLLDTAKVQRIVVNLLANAARHTPAGTRVEVRGHVRDGMVVLEVEDDGPGLPPELHDVVFDMFVKGSGERARSSGTGVGLGLVRQFSRLLGGDAEVSDGDLGGVCIRVTLPAQG